MRGHSRPDVMRDAVQPLPDGREHDAEDLGHASAPSPPEPGAEHVAPSAAEAPTGAVTMVPVAMEAGSPSPLHGPASNGAAVAVAEPAPAVETEVASGRERVLGSVELPPVRRPSAATIGALAAVAGLLALVLGTFAFLSALDDGGSSAEAAARDSARALSLLSKPSTERFPVLGSQGAVVLAVGSGGRAVLVLRGLEPAPSGSTYEAWVVDPAGGPPDPAGLFTAGERVVELTRPVPIGATVAVTVEDEVGSDTPTQPLRLVARRG